MGELIGGIRVVKMMAWESPLIKAIRKSRRFELKLIRIHAYYFSVGFNLIFMQFAQLIQLIVFSVYYAIGGDFSPSIIFTSIQFFQQMQQPLTQLPNALSTLSNTVVSIRRIQNFLMLPEVGIQTEKNIDA